MEAKGFKLEEEFCSFFFENEFSWKNQTLKIK